MFTTAKFSYRTCANDIDRAGQRYDADGPDGKLYSVLFFSFVQAGVMPVRYEIDGRLSERARTHVDVINHFKLNDCLEGFARSSVAGSSSAPVAVAE